MTDNGKRTLTKIKNMVAKKAICCPECMEYMEPEEIEQDINTGDILHQCGHVLQYYK